MYTIKKFDVYRIMYGIIDIKQGSKFNVFTELSYTFIHLIQQTHRSKALFFRPTASTDSNYVWSEELAVRPTVLTSQPYIYKPSLITAGCVGLYSGNWKLKTEN